MKTLFILLSSFAMALHDTDFDLRDVKPTSVFEGVVDFKAVSQTVGLGWLEGGVERGNLVGV